MQRTTCATPTAWYQSTSVKTWAKPFSNTCSTFRHPTLWRHDFYSCSALTIISSCISSYITGYQSSRAQRKPSLLPRYVHFLCTFNTLHVVCSPPHSNCAFAVYEVKRSLVIEAFLFHPVCGGGGGSLELGVCVFLWLKIKKWRPLSWTAFLTSSLCRSGNFQTMRWRLERTTPNSTVQTLRGKWVSAWTEENKLLLPVSMAQMTICFDYNKKAEAVTGLLFSLEPFGDCWWRCSLSNTFFNLWL